ncbi:MAG: 1-(5-phosphoribosyl)-5-[(5-phosphoribosylamino)methylideneamino]imidazole-4-carboxamide isomerase [Lactobacillus sp.]|jgi:phosphoribosylformimino-5-aminoimidazole carboxamide ribotide isomerase|nr:1-(5-phosphoribosyl)-5-[(5-phosphoribosylamino)methylideneamino]imidazole-4-carboxamide isomerase [Lactobacillus sp.]MCI2033556.1 1-(5-phosphoribosyl)-5-[(5-phosphoribosylamino)methylideneamino]imidazole-4-carboxamide isomerase [Lactobacillus sp.]
MQLFPAIDLLNGQSVRLFQGDYAQVSTINADPLVQAQAIQQAGLTNLHLVDLDGAKAGQPQNLATITRLRQNTDLFIEVGGGIRTLATIRQYLALGINRVILGSIALKAPDLVKQALSEFGADQIVIGIDAKNDRVATEGWLETSRTTTADLVAAMAQAGATTFIVTDIAKDGTLAGPNVTMLQKLHTQFPALTFVASGGMRTPQDLTDLQAAGIDHAIIGKALAAGSITLAQLKALEG